MEKEPPIKHEKDCLKRSKIKVWKFISYEDFSYKSKILVNRSCDFNWLKIEKDGTITVKGSFQKGYAWDGCTPKINLFHITWGLFDGQLTKFNYRNYKPYTYYASMVHDILYQYKRCVPVTRKEADLIFYELLKDAKFMWSHVFFFGARTFGWLLGVWKYKSSKDIENSI